MIVLEWIRFFFVAVLMLGGLCCFVSAVLGVHRFGFVMNRMHGSGIGDSLGLFCIAAGAALAAGPGMDLLKIFILVVFMWCTSPVSTHFVAQIEYYTNTELYRYTRRDEKPPEAFRDIEEVR